MKIICSFFAVGINQNIYILHYMYLLLVGGQTSIHPRDTVLNYAYSTILAISLPLHVTCVIHYASYHNISKTEQKIQRKMLDMSKMTDKDIVFYPSDVLLLKPIQIPPLDCW